MTSYFIGEDGPHIGTTIPFVEGDEWILGRDVDVCYFVLEDPMVSRKHALIRSLNDLYYLENLSTVNPILVNGEPIDGSYLLKEDDSIQIGNTFFRFTTTNSEPPKLEKINEDEVEEYVSTKPKPQFMQESEKRWMIKVISGPNQGAECYIDIGDVLVIGKDPTLSDIVFQDLSVSRKHAKLTCSESGLTIIEDLDSTNGTLVNGEKIKKSSELQSQDLVSIGTTCFLFIDRKLSRETIYAPLSTSSFEKITKEEITTEKVADVKNWRDTFIPMRHLIIAGIFITLIFIGGISIISLFKSQAIVVNHTDESNKIKETIANFKNIQFSYNPSNGTLFLIGHVLTTIDHNEIIYLIKTLPFIQNIEDNIIIDEKVWEEMNILLMKNPAWRGVIITSSTPGHFIMKGYIESEKEGALLQEYINTYFPYLNLLDNQVVVENSVNIQIQNLLIEKGLLNITFQFSNGELVFAGRLAENESNKLSALIDELKKREGIRQIKNFVILTNNESIAKIDISDKYNITGSSRYDGVEQYILINGKILSKGDNLDGMTITNISANEVQLDKDGIKYKIDYNIQ